MINTKRFFLWSAGFVTAWIGLVYIFHFVLSRYYSLPQMFFVAQDRYALFCAVLFLIYLTQRNFAGFSPARLPSPALIGGYILVATLVAWVGHYLVFAGYSLSRDEQMAEFATFYIRSGMLGMPIPLEWQDYVRGINPIFMSTQGGHVAWVSNYLPIHAAFRALVSYFADPALTSPLFLAIGYLALWRIARRLFSDRPDAVLVTLLLAFSSTQLLVMSMTAYAMATHFALNLVWLALFLRDDWKGHAGAVLVAVLASGLHQMHFHPLFAAGFIFWILVRRRWALTAYYVLAYAAIAVVWGKFYPALLSDIYSATVPLKGGKHIDLVSRIELLINHRLGRDMLPLLNLARFIAWNNVLLLPLAALGAMQLRWRSFVSKDASIVLPLAICCGLGLALMVYQGHGWGYRYLHGLIGPFCLLAGFGWIRLSGPDKSLSLKPVWLSVGFAALVTVFLTIKAHDFVKPYARAYHMAKSIDADVVLVDTRAGVFIQDIVRIENGVLSRPILMDLDFVDFDKLAPLCRKYKVRIFDQTHFLPLGVPPSKVSVRWSKGRAMKRAYLARIGCGQEPLTFTRSDWR